MVWVHQRTTHGKCLLGTFSLSEIITILFVRSRFQNIVDNSPKDDLNTHQYLETHAYLHVHSPSTINKFQYQPTSDNTVLFPLFNNPSHCVDFAPSPAFIWVFYLLFTGGFYSQRLWGSKVLAVVQFDLQLWMKSTSGGKQGHFGNIKTLPCNYNENT